VYFDEWQHGNNKQQQQQQQQAKKDIRRDIKILHKTEYLGPKRLKYFF
jgi:hypothetical protein